MRILVNDDVAVGIFFGEIPAFEIVSGRFVLLEIVSRAGLQSNQRICFHAEILRLTVRIERADVVVESDEIVIVGFGLRRIACAKRDAERQHDKSANQQ